MNRTITIKFVPPPPIKEKISKTLTRERHWNTDKLIALLERHLTPQLQQALGDDIELNIILARQADIRLNFKIDAMNDFKEHLGELIAEAMSEVEPDSYLLD